MFFCRFCEIFKNTFFEFESLLLDSKLARSAIFEGNF